MSQSHIKGVVSHIEAALVLARQLRDHGPCEGVTVGLAKQMELAGRDMQEYINQSFNEGQTTPKPAPVKAPKVLRFNAGKKETDNE